MYRAKFAFEGQEGEMSLQKDDVVELIRKDDDGGEYTYPFISNLTKAL
jgi:hypothetical protein